MNIFSVNQGCFSGIVVYKKGGRLGTRVQNDLQLVYIHYGEVHIKIDGREHYLGPGEATLLLPGREESFQFSTRTQTRHGWCGVHMPQFDAGVLRQLETLDFRYAFTDRMKAIEQLFLPIRESSEPGLTKLHANLVQGMLIEFLNQTGIYQKTKLPQHPAVARVCAHINLHFRTELDLEALAEQAHVTPPHLIRIFKKELNQTPMAYAWKIRTHAAAHLLRSTGLSASEVAYECGFANPNHFSRTFKKHYGQAPGVWRKYEWNAQ